MERACGHPCGEEQRMNAMNENLNLFVEEPNTITCKYLLPCGWCELKNKECTSINAIIIKEQGMYITKCNYTKGE